MKAAFLRIRPHFRGNVIRVYREIVAPTDWKPDPNRHPGPYWSWDENVAEAHNGSFSDGNIGWMLVADVPVFQVDWVVSLSANAHPAFGDQAEIYVPETTPIKIISYYKSR